MTHKYDFLVIGSGIAGMSFALKVAPHSKVAIVTKNLLEDGNTFYAQGGIATVSQKLDNFDKHITDTCIAGAGLCDSKVVEKV
ncbi:MAG: FAD-binding protein, partial [Bacteroidales bacterium]|nr:FAD-binding protein [Bacteroidales bacterium]